MPNRLIGESSPYLLQHAHNPVDWVPWGDAAFELARAQDKPVFLSIGYSACHWCHVMERESFADNGVAAALNRAFVSVKVDREERPDVDHFYMQACQQLTGGGGWPLTALLTPDRKPFFAGTYYPKDGLLSVLSQAEALWRGSRDQLLRAAEDLTLLSAERFQGAGAAPPDAAGRAVRQLMAAFDRRHGGFGGAPKFPSPHNLLLLMRFARKEPEGSEIWRAVGQTLRAMARGGLRDHLGGGFCRYSTDARWLLPHFEKMLYDNALLIMAYTEHAQKTGSEDSGRVVHETAAYVFREMADPGTGLFYTAQDADAGGEEGRFYTFTPGEVRAALGGEADRFCEAFGIRPGGHLDGRSVPNLLAAPEIALFDPALAGLRETLFIARSSRAAPFRDEKSLLSSNALMVAALAKAGAAFGREEYTRAAARAARFILRRMRGPRGRFFAVWAEGRASQAATLDGYAYLAWALVELHQADFSPDWLAGAQALARETLALFEGENGGLYYTGRDVSDLPGRGINAWDGAAPSGQSVMAHNLVRLSRLLGQAQLEQRARDLIGSLGAQAARSPMGHAFLMAALDYLEDGGAHVDITGGQGGEELLRAARQGYRPYLTVRLEPGNGPAAARVCTNRACRPPVKTARELAAVLEDM
ncbi:MAG: thioredoxin domain-containing protein [Oscillospiraceae bacterium]|jgi:uncharacterized protein YyaL (SSP411 family)|nr:thioredoxin domain-containing protein [Oscillospiraceae bacterium]